MEVQERFKDIFAHEKDFKIFSSPFAVDIQTIPAFLQLELIELQCNCDLKVKFSEVALLMF